MSHPVSPGSSAEAWATRPIVSPSLDDALAILREPLQARAPGQLAASVLPGGTVVLGEAEWPASTGRLEPVDRKRRIFRRIDEGVAR